MTMLPARPRAVALAAACLAAACGRSPEPESIATPEPPAAEVRAAAERAGNDPVRILRYVADAVAYEPYVGNVA